MLTSSPPVTTRPGAPVSPAPEPTTEPTTEPTGKPRGKRRLILILVLVLVLGGGGFVGSKHFTGAPNTNAAAHEPGAVITLDPITLNLADTHYLKLGVALQMSKAASPIPGAQGDAGTVDGAKALDAAISVLGRHTYDQLLAPGGRASALKALSREVSKRYDGDVLRVYFTEFLMQ